MARSFLFAPGDVRLQAYGYNPLSIFIYLKISNASLKKQVFKNDEMVLKFSSTGPKGEELLPQGVVAATKQSNIVVADQALNNISLYSCDGNLLEVIVENVVKPWGICFSEVKYLLAVATADGLKVYKL